MKRISPYFQSRKFDVSMQSGFIKTENTNKMKQIKLKDGITLMAVEVDTNFPYKWYEEERSLDAVFSGDKYMTTKYFKPHSVFLGTAPELLAREDAEEVCHEFVDRRRFGMMDTKIYYHYVWEVHCYRKQHSAKDSFRSALKKMNYVDGEILIIKVEGEGNGSI